MAIKAVHITEAWTGGIATYVKTLIDYQTQSDEFAEVSLIYAENRKFTGAGNAKLYKYTSSRNPLKFFSIAREINKILQEINPDIVHLHSTFPGVYGRLIKKFPTIYCAHGWSFTQDVNILKKLIYAVFEAFLAKRTDAIVNISNNEYKAAKKFGVMAKYNFTILNGVEDIKEPSQSSKIKANKEVINIGFIGRLDHQKGFDIIEPFFRENQFNNIKLYVIGEAERSYAVTYRGCDGIEYLGWVDNKDIGSYMAEFDAIIVPSRYEGFGLVVIEAMRSGKPVIVSNRGALPELVKEGINGHIFNIDYVEEQLSPIIKALDKKTLAQMGRKAREIYLEKFTSKRFCDETTGIYNKVLGR